MPVFWWVARLTGVNSLSSNSCVLLVCGEEEGVGVGVFLLGDSTVFSERVIPLGKKAGFNVNVVSHGG